MPIGSLGTFSSGILIKILRFSFTKMHLKTSSAKWRPFCPVGEMSFSPLGNLQIIAAQTMPVMKYEEVLLSLQWRHNGRDGVSNHQPHHCLLNRIFRWRSKKTSKLRVTGLCVGNSPVTGESPHNRPVTRKIFLFDDVIMCWRGTYLRMTKALPQHFCVAPCHNNNIRWDTLLRFSVYGKNPWSIFIAEGFNNLIFYALFVMGSAN